MSPDRRGSRSESKYKNKELIFNKHPKAFGQYKDITVSIIHDNILILVKVISELLCVKLHIVKDNLMELLKFFTPCASGAILFFRIKMLSLSYE